MELILNSILDLIGVDAATITLLAGAVIAVANFVTATTPSVGKNKYYNLIMKVLNTLAVNRGKNKNADEVAAKELPSGLSGLKFVLILLLPLFFVRCTATTTLPAGEDKIGTQNLTEIVHAAYKSYEGVKAYQAQSNDVLTLALSLSSDLVAAFKDASFAIDELKELTDFEILNLVNIADQYNIIYKEKVKAVFKVALFTVQGYFKFIEKKEVTFRQYLGLKQAA